MADELVSVVIPFYKGKEWLRQALESVFLQTYPSIEIILINDGSPENIDDILKKYKNEIKYVYQENYGVARARNKGIRLSKGKYIAFLDSDDLWLPNKLEVQISMMREKNATWSHSNYIKFDAYGNEKEVDVSTFKGNVFPLSIISNPIATPSVVIQKKVLEENQLYRFHDGMEFGEDTVLWLLLSMEFNLLSINKPLVKVRIRGSNSAMMAYSQIKAKSEIWNFIKQNNLFDYSKELSFYSRLSFSYCTMIFKLLERFKFKNTSNTKELVSKLLYVIPYSLFKVDKFLIKMKYRR